MCTRLFTAALAVLATPLCATADPITAAGWQRHPAVLEIRAIYRETQRAEAAGGLKKEQRFFAYCRPYEDGERILYRDRAGTVRSYHRGAGSDDSAMQAAYDYDRQGRLRFVFAAAGAANGTVAEYRVYLSRDGGRQWQERRDLKGPGYAFPAELPDQWLIKDPAEALRAENACAEEKPER
jgi:hypothetical protein